MTHETHQQMLRLALQHTIDARDEIVSEQGVLVCAAMEAHDLGEDDWAEHQMNEADSLDPRITELEEQAVDLAFRSIPILVIPHLPYWLRNAMFKSGRTYPVRSLRR